jgi:GNAT superfamily N-acetyltransferase
MVEIIEYENRYQPAFYQLNKAWLDKYQLTESHDLEVLNDPEATILKRGGYIWLAKENDTIVGSAALILQQKGVYELAKMAVADACQGRGISKLLLRTCLQKAKDLKAIKLELFSNHQLKTALRLYESHGFRQIPVVDSPFVTADVKMELNL